MACSCKCCVLGLVLVLGVLCYSGCSLHCALVALGHLPVLGPLLIESGFVVMPISATAPKSANDVAPPLRLFTAEELMEYRGGEKGLYAASLGLVYDVRNAEEHYSPGKEFHGLTGRDGSRAFVTGDFSDKGCVDHVSDFKPEQYQALTKWTSKFPQDYPLMGKLIGRYYDENGNPTEEQIKVIKAIEDAPKIIEMEKELKIIYPGCSSRFVLREGGKFWCRNDVKGIERDWVGYPRRFSNPESGRIRCACVPDMELPDSRFTEYENCPKDAHECHLDYVHHDEL